MQCHEERRARKMNIMARCAIYTSFLKKEASFIFYDELSQHALSLSLTWTAPLVPENIYHA